MYSDMLGTAQALKAVNMPFNQNLVTALTRTYPSMNPMLFKCQDFADINEKNWSLLRNCKVIKSSAEDEDTEGHLPAI